MKMSKKFIALILISVLIFIVQGCGSSTKSSEQPKATTGENAKPAGSDTLKVALILTGSADDASWDASMYQTLKNIKDMVNITFDVSENVAPADAERIVRDYASRDYNLIIGHAFAFKEATLNVAKDFPKVKFMYGNGQDFAPNVLAYDSDYHDTAYLAGVLSASLITGNKVGVVASMDIPPVVMSVESFADGAKAAKPSINVMKTYIGTFTDPAKGKDGGLAQIANGAEVVVALGDGTGLGTVNACKEKGVKCIGYYYDQASVAPEVIVSSVVNNWEPMMIKAINDIRADKFGNSFYMNNLANDGVILAPYHDYDSKIPDEVKKKVEAVRQDIISGKLKVETITKPR